jgi:hypothetical protein
MLYVCKFCGGVTAPPQLFYDLYEKTAIVMSAFLLCNRNKLQTVYVLTIKTV